MVDMNTNEAPAPVNVIPRDLGLVVAINEVDPAEALAVEITARAILAEAIKRIELETGYRANLSTI